MPMNLNVPSLVDFNFTKEKADYDKILDQNPVQSSVQEIPR